MNVEEKQICRLCLDVAYSEFEEISEIIRNMLEVLLLEMDRDIIENPMICKTCTMIIRRSFYFKSTCIRTEKLLTYFAIDKREVKFKLNDVIYNKRGTEVAVEENFRCRFCMNPIKNNEFVHLDVLTEETLCKEMLPIYMAEMDFGTVDNPIVCGPCKENLNCYIAFARNLFRIENKIHKYGQKIGNLTGGNKSDAILQFLCGTNRRGLDGCTWTPSNEGELTASEEWGKANPWKFTKIEEISAIDDRDTSFNEFREGLSQKSDENGYDFMKNEEIVPSGTCPEVDSTCNCKSSTTNTNQRRHTSGMTKVEHKCTVCTFSSKVMFVVQNHMSTHEDPLEIDRYKCSYCPYNSKYKSNVKRHMLVHKDVSEVQMYNCVSCIFTTKYKCTFDKHVLTHEDASDLGKYLCSQCPYSNKSRAHLKRHMLVHMDNSEVQMYKCETCPYESKYKSTVQQHALTHKAASEVDIYECSRCNYKTRWKHHLKSHMIVHRDESEVQVFKCNQCAYATRYQRGLQQHSLTHKDPSEVEMYRCSRCAYETKWKSHLKHHMIAHKDASEVEMHECASCPYTTKYKRTLELHALTHKDASEVKMYKCTFCPHETKWKNLLKRHILTHKDASELQMYECTKCLFKTKYKYNVKKHMDTHAAKAEVAACDAEGVA